VKQPFNINDVKVSKKQRLSVSPSSETGGSPDKQLRKAIGPKKLAMRKISSIENLDIS
jgi:hypothetical protein